MNMIPQSNGLYRLKWNKKKSKFSIIKVILLVLVILFLGGFIFQMISDFIGNEEIKRNYYYAKIENNKVEYDYLGEGDYTIVFDGAIGTNYYAWDDIAERVRKELKVKTFLYNRYGYGFSEISDNKTTVDQAKDLKILLRKAGISGKIIFVSEEYGSLISTAFAEMFPSSVEGLVLIKPLSETTINSKEYKDSIKSDYYHSISTKIASYFGGTRILELFNMTYNVKDFEESLQEKKLTEYEVQKNQSNYRKAIEMELSNVYFYEENIQKPGMLKDKYLYIISQDKEDDIKFIGTNDHTTISQTSIEDGLVSINDKDGAVNAITYVVNALRRDSKKTKN